jgi:hypothetical protein
VSVLRIFLVFYVMIYLCGPLPSPGVPSVADVSRFFIRDCH